MPSPRTESDRSAVDATLWNTAITRLQQGVNPFADQVAAVGTAEASLRAGLPDFAAAQRAEILAIIDLYRTNPPPTRTFQVLGERGAGKTHLLYSLREELRVRAADTGEETLLVIVERLSPGMDAIDYLLWQIVNHLQALKGEGGRLLRVIAGRLTAQLLVESLRTLAPHQRLALFPPEGLLSRLGLGGSQAAKRLAAIDDIIQQCDARHPTCETVRAALSAAGLRPESALDAILQHLERSESKDVIGWFRRELYGRLARFGLTDHRGPFEDFHNGDFDMAPPNVKSAGNLGRRLLEVWLELLTNLNIPIVIVFDQLEDYLRVPNQEQQKFAHQFFVDALARFINELRHVCMIVFAEESFWTDLVNNADAFTRERLTQPFGLPGLPAKPHIVLPSRFEMGMLERIVQRRIQYHFPDLDLTGLPASFPFAPADLKKLQRETTLRACLRRLATRYDDILYPLADEQTDEPRKTHPPRPNLAQRLKDLWTEKIDIAAKQYTSSTYSTTFIPEVQNALDGWLQTLHQHGLASAANWHKVELVTDTKKQQYGYLNVIRTDGPDAPGLGIAAWLGEGRSKPHDLRRRLEFFQANPCPIRTLIMLRSRENFSLTGESLSVYESARNENEYDVRIHQYEARHLHALMAFSTWLQAASTEVQAATEADPAATSTYRDFLSGLAKEWLAWVDAWQRPEAAAPGALL